MNRIRKYLEDHRAVFVTEIRASSVSGIDFVLNVQSERVSRKARPGFTSKHQMALLKKAIQKQLGLEIEWIVIRGHESKVIEASLRNAISRRFPGVVSHLYMSSSLDPATIWMEIERGQNSREAQDLRSFIREFLLRLGVIDVTFVLGQALGHPTDPQVLRILKRLAPASDEGLFKELIARGFQVMDMHNLRSRLDALRKKGLVVRGPRGFFSLTEKALGLVPYGRSRASSDVDRVLALARRRW